jgi:phosphoketolase
MADVEVQVRLSESEAWDLAQFLKRVGFDQFYVNAQDSDEAYRMMFAAEKVRKALAEAGYSPR